MALCKPVMAPSQAVASSHRVWVSPQYRGWTNSLWEITQPFRAALSRRELGTVGAGLTRDTGVAGAIHRGGSAFRASPLPCFH